MEKLVAAFNFDLYVIILGIVAPVYIYAMRKVFYSWFDPLLILLVFNSFSISFVLYLYIELGIRSFYFYTFISSVLFFSIGLLLGNKPVHAISEERFLENRRLYSGTVTWVLVVSLFVLLAGNISLFVAQGVVPIISDDPQVYKVSLYQGGFGFVKRLNDILLPAVFAVAFLRLFVIDGGESKYRKTYWLAVFVALVLLLSTGSKGAFLSAVYVLFYVYLINVFRGRGRGQGAARVRVYVRSFFFLALIYAIFVFVLAPGGAPRLAYNVIERLVGSGDTFYYFYVFDIYPDFRMGVQDFLYRLIEPLAGLLRLVDYKPSVGELILFESVGVQPSGYGPNSQYPTEGLLFFGPVFSLVYSFSVGFLVASLRTRTFSWLGLRSHPQELNLLAYIVVAYISTRLPVDMSTFMGGVYNSLVILGPVVMLSFVLDNLLRWRSYRSRTAYAG